jgi:hypothetical protein
MLCTRARMFAFSLIAVAAASGCRAYDESLLQSNRMHGVRGTGSSSSDDASSDAAVSDASSVSGDAGESSDSGEGSLKLDSGWESDRRGSMGESAADAAAAGSGANTAGSGGAAEAGGGGGSGGTAGAAGGSSAQAGAGGMPATAVPCTDANGRVWESNGHCYFPLSVMNSWYVSRDRCHELGAHLVSISSAEEQVFVSTLVGSTPRWTGLARFGAPAFSWVDGESMTYENWEAGAPTQMSEAAVAVRTDTYLWFDAAVSEPHAALCERQ